MEDEYIGVIKIFAGHFAPQNFFFCNGQELPISQFQSLYSIIGITYGGNGTTTFKLPDLRGRVPLSAGSAPGVSTYTLGNFGGTETVTLSISQMPTHNHIANTQSVSTSSLGISATVNAGTAGTPTNNPTGAYWGQSPASGPSQAQDYTNSKNVTMATDAVQVQLSGTIPATPVTVENNGGNAAHENRQPYLAINYIICHTGLYPTRT